MANLTAKDWERIKRVAPLDTDVILLSGSATEGFANPQSDVDILVVYQGGTDRDRPSERLYTADTTGQRIQVSACSAARVSDLQASVARIRAAAPLDRPPSLDAFTDDGLMWYYRIGTGELLSGATEQLEAIRGSLSMQDFGVVYSEVCRWLSLEALADSELTAGTHGILVAEALAESALWAAEAHLATQGEAYPRRKWLFEKARRRFGSESSFYQTVWDLKAIGERSLPQYRAQVHGFLGTLHIDPRDAVRVPPRRYQRHPGVRVFELAGECYAIQHHSKLYRLPSEAVDLWAALEEPVTEVELASAVQPATLQHCGSLLQELASRNLVTTAR